MDSKLQTIRELIKKNTYLSSELKTRLAQLDRLKSRLAVANERDYLRQSSIYNNLARSHNHLNEELNLASVRLDDMLNVNESVQTSNAKPILSRMVADKSITQEESHRAIRGVIDKRLNIDDFIQVMADRPRQSFFGVQEDSYRKRCETSLMEMRVFIWEYTQTEESESNGLAELQTRLRVCTLEGVKVNVVAGRNV